ncbi:hypothetical protein [uncultured Legionella sp.]|uniref:hypothetical protein n=1 Tax=uncultured Legionella sp. TaxID=210934 RepID=UPI002608757D|nr:hypothetical protein [uncultured Legionella sp.]
MALSEIIINDIVRKRTNAVIKASDFHNLRQYLLNREPLLTVTNSIDLLLREQFSDDRQAAVEAMAQEAYDAQRTSDKKETRADEHERTNDELLKVSYSQELPSLENKKNQLDERIYQQQNYHAHIRSQVSEYKINLDQINRTIARLQSDRNIINSRYVLNAPFPHGNIHAHVQVFTHEPNMHVHGHIHTHNNGLNYPNHGHMLFSLQDQIALDSLVREEHRLNDERIRLTRLIDVKEAELFNEGQQLSTIVTEKRQTENRFRELKHQLETEIPNREWQRQNRNQERMDREDARSTHDPELQQLSDKNREALKQRILTKIDELDKTREQLMKEATEVSYQTFIEQLDETVELEVSYYEREALNSIREKMIKYSALQQQEKKTSHSLQDTRTILSTLQQKFNEHTRTLQGYEASNPQLKQANKLLVEENGRLYTAREGFNASQTSALYWSLFSGASAGISAAVIGSLLVSPVFFALSGALALVTVISLTVAGVYHYQKSACNDKMDENHKAIRNNKAIISEHDKEAATLRTTTLPELSAKIEETSQSISLIAKQLEELQHNMKKTYTKAQNITELQGNRNGFFGQQAATNVLPFQKDSSHGFSQFEESSAPVETTSMEFPHEEPPQYNSWFRGYGNY